MICLVGCKGSMGQRYSAILKHMRVPFYGIDMGEPVRNLTTSAIIATPTDTHHEWCKYFAERNIRFLCEKPVSKKPSEIEDIIKTCDKSGANASMVCNWAYSGKEKFFPERCIVEYDFFKTGNDGLLFDCIQLIYLAQDKTLSLRKVSPFFFATINKQKIALADIEWSYVHMLRDFLNHKPLWSMHDALSATEKVLEMGGE